MDANNPTDVGLPLAECPGQSAFYDIEDPTWLAWVLHRLAQGDRVTIERDGSLVITNGA